MTGFADTGLRRWQFPELAPLSAPAAAQPDAPDDPAPPQPEIPDVPAPPDTADAAAAAEAARETIAQASERGYADGLQRGLTEGREKGYAEGVAAGSKAAQEALAENAQRVAAILSRLSVPMPALERVMEDAVVALAIELARCVIGSEISQSRDSLVRLIREALTQVPLRVNGLRIALHPADLKLIRELAPDLESGGAALVGDTAVEAGGCLIFVNGESPAKDRRWRPRAADGSQIDLSLAARWRSAMLTLFEGEGG